MKSSANVLYILLLCLITSACTSSTALESQNTIRESKIARIYFIRPSTFVGALQSIRVTVNDRKVGNLGVGTHLYIDRPPGQYNVVIEHEFDFGKWEQNISVSSSKDYYFAIAPGNVSVTAIGNTAVVNGRMNIIAVSPDEGRALVEATKD